MPFLLFSFKAPTKSIHYESMKSLYSGTSSEGMLIMTDGKSRDMHNTLNITLLIKLNARVASSTVSKDWSHLGNTIGILEKDNIPIILNELR